MAVQIKPRFYSPEEYLMLEREADFKSEYLDGQIYAMSGGSPRHSAIAFNIGGVFAAQLSGKPCQGFNSDAKVRTSPTGYYGYPDLSIVCGEPEYHDEKEDVLTNPIVIVEVLSPTTEAFDRGKKFARYRHLDSLTDYLLVSQEEPRIEQYTKQSRNHWLLTVAEGLEAVLQIDSLGCTLRLSQVYERITFPVPEEQLQ
jgi:Uma2 family endonuclease